MNDIEYYNQTKNEIEKNPNIRILKKIIHTFIEIYKNKNSINGELLSIKLSEIKQILDEYFERYLDEKYGNIMENRLEKENMKYMYQKITGTCQWDMLMEFTKLDEYEENRIRDLERMQNFMRPNQSFKRPEKRNYNQMISNSNRDEVQRYNNMNLNNQWRQRNEEFMNQRNSTKGTNMIKTRNNKIIKKQYEEEDEESDERSLNKRNKKKTKKLKKDIYKYLIYKLNGINEYIKFIDKEINKYYEEQIHTREEIKESNDHIYWIHCKIKKDSLDKVKDNYYYILDDNEIYPLQRLIYVLSKGYIIKKIPTDLEITSKIAKGEIDISKEIENARKKLIEKKEDKYELNESKTILFGYNNSINDSNKASYNSQNSPIDSNNKRNINQNDNNNEKVIIQNKKYETEKSNKKILHFINKEPITDNICKKSEYENNIKNREEKTLFEDKITNTTKTNFYY